jgi:hypothetical protein
MNAGTAKLKALFEQTGHLIFPAVEITGNNMTASFTHQPQIKREIMDTRNG